MKKKFLKVLISLPTIAMLLSGCAKNDTPVEPAASDKEEEKEKEEPQKEEPTEPVVEGIKVDTNYPTQIEYLTEDGFQIHYLRKTGSYKEWGLWLWGSGKDGAEYTFNYQNDKEIIAYYPVSQFSNGETTIGFIVKELFEFAGEGVWNKDAYGDDRFIDFKGLKKDEHNIYHLYLVEGDGKIYTNYARTLAMDAVTRCELESKTKFTVTCNNPMSNIKLYENGQLYKEVNFSKSTKTYSIKATEGHEFELTNSYYAEITFKDSKNTIKANVVITKLYNNAFETEHYYDGELGAIVENDKTTFKVWSPVSTKIVLKVYDTGTPGSLGGNDNTIHSVEMTKNEKGVFETTINQDLSGKYYTYKVFNGYNLEGTEIVDPYAKSAGVNGLRGMIVDFSETNPIDWESQNFETPDRKSMVVYETHVADVSSSDSWNGTQENKYKFKGLIEENTSIEVEEGKTISTGYDHIKDLRVNAIQLIPIFDQANDEINTSFNWGYNPLNYNVVEGSYSSDPYNGYVRIKELKEVVKKFHQNGQALIMDVVYNHVNGLKGSNFDVLMPYYYFRYDAQGGALNGSGCGNTTASNHLMFRKFMIDSAKFWAKEYKIDGFRFDLMGLHDLETMNQLTAAVKEINPKAVIYGEPWDMGTGAGLDASVLAVQSNASKYQGFGQFNDQFRDGLIKGGLAKPTEEVGWAMQKTGANVVSAIVDGLYGKTKGATDDPEKTVNYVSCHDNYTLHDRAYVYGYRDAEEIEKMNLVANALTFLSQGTSFMLAGEEMLRSKKLYDADGKWTGEVSGNSYTSSYRTNELDWNLLKEHSLLNEIYSYLISLKLYNSSLHLGKEEINDSLYKVSAVTEEGIPEGSIIKISFTAGTIDVVAYVSNGTLNKDYVIDTSKFTNHIGANEGFKKASDGVTSYTLKGFDLLIGVTKN